MPLRAEPRLGETVALGLLQGPAELLPISSSAHVELLPWLLGWRHAELPGAARKEVAVALHAGTAVALAGAGGLRGLRPLLLAAATAPPALAGLALEELVERRLGTPRAIAAGLVAGSVALVLGDRAPERRSAAEAGPRDGLWLGLAQACALAPGVSRSGAARAAARALGFTRADAAELSAEIALPVIAGAAVVKGVRVIGRRPAAREAAALLAGGAAAAASTALARRLERGVTVPPAAWAAYRVALAAAVLRADRALRQNGRR